MNKILYIRLDSSPLPEESDEIIVKDFNLESYFCTLLGKRLLEEAGQAGAMLYPGKLLTDFEKFDKEAYREIIQQWEGILASFILSQQDRNREYEIKFPVLYYQWLDSNEYPECSKISVSLKVSRKIVLSSKVIYVIIHSVLLKKLSYFLQKNVAIVKCIVFSIDGLGEQSYMRHLIDIYNIEVRTLQQSCVFLPYDKIETSNTSAILKRGGTNKVFIYGKKMLECSYDEIGTLVNGYARVRKGNKWGTINEDGVEIIPCIYDCIGTFYKETFSEKLMAYARLKSKWGYIDINSEVVIPFDYEDINSFQGKYVWAKLNGKWGTIDINNKIRIPFVYENPGFSSYGLYDYYFIKSNSKEGIINNDGSVYLPCIFDRIDSDSEFHLIVYKDGRQDVATFYKQHGYLRYYNVWSFCNGMAIVKYPCGGKYGFINESGDEVIIALYDSKPDTFNKAGIACVCKNGKYGIIDKSGKEIVPFIYEYISGVSVSNLMLAKKQGKYGYLNNKGEEVLPFIYDDACSFDKEGVARVVNNGKKMCIDETGKTMFCNLTYNSIGDFCNGVAVAYKDGKIWLIDRQGKEIWPCGYKCDSYVNRIYLEDFLIVSREKKYGILNLDGKELIPCILDDISPFSGEDDNFKRYGVAKRNNKYALIEITKDRKGITIL